MAGADLLEYASIVIEAVIALAAVYMATEQHKRYGWPLALTFVLYVVFDLSRLGAFPLADGVKSALFLVASVSMLAGVVMLVREK
jgi:hypothetical protein